MSGSTPDGAADGALPGGFVLARVGADGDPSSFLELCREGEREGTGVRCDLSRVSLRGGLAEARASRDSTRSGGRATRPASPG